MSKSNQATSVPTTQELKELIQGCRLEFVNNSFTELAEMHIKRGKIRALLQEYDPDKAKLAQLLSGWPRFNVGNIVWAMSACPVGGVGSAETDEADDKTDTDRLSHNVFIDLSKITLNLAEQSFDLGLTMLKLSSSETKSRYLCVDGEDDYPCTVLISTDKAGKKYLMLASYDKDEDVLWAVDNVEEFSMLSVVSAGADDKDAADRKGYIFTYFNKGLQVAFSEVLTELNDIKLSTDNIERAEVVEPLTDLLDGCYCYLKNKDVPFTRAQKHFFTNYQPTKVAKTYSEEEVAKIISSTGKLSEKN